MEFHWESELKEEAQQRNVAPLWDQCIVQSNSATPSLKIEPSSVYGYYGEYLNLLRPEVTTSFQQGFPSQNIASQATEIHQQNDLQDREQRHYDQVSMLSQLPEQNVYQYGQQLSVSSRFTWSDILHALRATITHGLFIGSEPPHPQNDATPATSLEFAAAKKKLGRRSPKFLRIVSCVARKVAQIKLELYGVASGTEVQSVVQVQAVITACRVADFAFVMVVARDGKKVDALELRRLMADASFTVVGCEKRAISNDFVASTVEVSSAASLDVRSGHNANACA